MNVVYEWRHRRDAFRTDEGRFAIGLREAYGRYDADMSLIVQNL